jgi:hypothetical protein
MAVADIVSALCGVGLRSESQIVGLEEAIEIVEELCGT